MLEIRDVKKNTFMEKISLKNGLVLHVLLKPSLTADIELKDVKPLMDKTSKSLMKSIKRWHNKSIISKKSVDDDRII